LEQFSAREGHCRVSQNYDADDGYRLGRWVTKQRGKKDGVNLDRRQRLEALPGWSWDPHSDQWENGFSHLKQFSDQERHCQVPNTYETDDDYRLGQWVAVQRANRESMDLYRRQRLEALPGWSWDALSDKWEEGFSHLKQFSEREGHCRVPKSYRTNEGYRLGQWVAVQRKNKNRIDRNNRMNFDRRQRLEALPGWSWDALSDKWEEGFSHLEQFSERVGHCRVVAKYKTDHGYRLGQWVSIQRAKRDTMEPDRRQRLEALPAWLWKVKK
jgi:Helicase associated domain